MFTPIEKVRKFTFDSSEKPNDHSNGRLSRDSKELTSSSAYPQTEIKMPKLNAMTLFAYRVRNNSSMSNCVYRRTISLLLFPTVLQIHSTKISPKTLSHSNGLKPLIPNNKNSRGSIQTYHLWSLPCPTQPLTKIIFKSKKGLNIPKSETKIALWTQVVHPSLMMSLAMQLIT